MDIPVEPCPQRSSRLSGKQPGKLGQHITATGDTRSRAPLTRHIISLSSISTSKLLTENEELVYAGTKLSHSFAASPQISTKKWRAPQPPKPVDPAHPPPPVRALRPLPQSQGPNPPSAVGEPKATDCCSQ